MTKIKTSMRNDNTMFAIFATVLQVAMIVLFAILVDYPAVVKKRAASHADVTDATEVAENTSVITVLEEVSTETVTNAAVEVEVDAAADVNTYYPVFQDVHTMIFIGFGFLMTFLKRYSYSSVGLNLLLAAFAIQWSTIVFGFLHRTPGDPTIYVDMTLMINAEFTAGTVLISFGAVLGKTTPLQLLIMTVCEVFIAKIAEYVCVHMLHATDVGGSMFIHAFGAYFGLALSSVLCFKRNNHKESENEVATKTSDVFAMVGTVFLWMFWPSFNGALAAGALRQRAITNTYFALSGAAIACFIMSAFVEPRNRFNMVHIQNASLAGGVAIGTCADLAVGPWVALTIGCIAATVSVLGYRYITPKLNNWIHDTCGVHDLHGMPGIIGAIAGILFTGLGYYDANPSGDQALAQIGSLAIVLGFAIFGGILVGIVLRLPLIRQITDSNEFYDDHKYWHVPAAQAEHHGDGDQLVSLANNDKSSV